MSGWRNPTTYYIVMPSNIIVQSHWSGHYSHFTFCPICHLWHCMRQHSTNKTENVFGLPAAAATKKCELSNGSLTTPELCAFLCSSSCTLFVSSCYSKLSKFALEPVAFITLHFLILLIFSWPCSTFPYCLSFCSKAPTVCSSAVHWAHFIINIIRTI